MPNWCTNTLTVTGDPKEVAQFRRKTRGTEPEHRPCCTACEHPYVDHAAKSRKCLFGAYKYTPPPDPQLGREPTGQPKKKERRKLAALSFHALVPVPKHVLDDVYDPVGYNWRLRHWGTKWDPNVACVERPNKNTLIYYFDTAWSPPREWFEAMIKRFPTLNFNMEFYECGVGFAGCFSGQEGALTEEEYDYDSWARENHPEWYEDDEPAAPESA